MDDTLSLVLFSGTDDKLHAAGTLAAGAAAMGRPVNVLLQYWALDAFRAAAIDADHGLAFDSIRPGTRSRGRRRPSRWSWSGALPRWRSCRDLLPVPGGTAAAWTRS